MTRQRSLLASTAGFTLVELLTTVVIIGILSAMAAPKLGAVVRGGKLRGTVDQVSADISYARILAVRSGRTASLCFDSTDRRVYQIVTGTCAAVTATRKRQDLRADAAGVSVSVTQGTATLTGITFNSRGMVSGLTSDGLVKVTATQRGKASFLELTRLGKTSRTY